MAQLPPKIPSMAPTAEFSPQFLPSPSLMSVQSAAVSTPSWLVDDFLDFSATRRGMHRRSASDSVAFLETPSLIMEECRLGNAILTSCGNAPRPHQPPEFDKFDDEQFLSMFTDDDEANTTTITSATANGGGMNAPSCSNPSTPSDRDTMEEDERETALEKVQSPRDQDVQGSTPPNYNSAGRHGDRSIDPRRVKRILANRQSAQRSRVRKLQYISELEHSVTSLQAEVSVLSPRVAFLDRQRLILNVDNSALKQRIAALAQDKIFKDAHQEALKREIDRLTQVYHQQRVKKMHHELPPQNPAGVDSTTSSEQEQLLVQV